MCPRDNNSLITILLKLVISCHFPNTIIYAFIFLCVIITGKIDLKCKDVYNYMSIFEKMSCELMKIVNESLAAKHSEFTKQVSSVDNLPICCDLRCISMNL